VAIIVILLLCAFASAACFASRGKNVVGGFFLGLLLGPIGLGVAIVVWASTPPPEKTRLCIYCRAEVPFEATVCRHCTREIGPPAHWEKNPAPRASGQETLR